MKKTSFLALFCSMAILSYSQTTQNCDKIKFELARLQDENSSLRYSLKIGEPLKEISSDNINFKLLKVIGDQRRQTSTFTFTPSTNVANWYIMSGLKSIIDIDGNEYRLKSYTIGAENSFNQILLNTDVLIKCTYTFEGILPTVKIIRLLKFDYTHKFGEPYFV